MGIHYDYKSTKSAKLMEKQAKREKKLAEKKAKRLAKEKGLLVGISAGANVLAAEQWVKENNPEHPVVTILCDRGERYFSCYED